MAVIAALMEEHMSRRILSAFVVATASLGCLVAAADMAIIAPSAQTMEVAFRDAAVVPAPTWTTYALTDALFWGRDNQSANAPLVVTVDEPDVPVISAGDPQFPFSEGVRAFYGRRSPDEGGWEIGYFGVYGQLASRFAAFPGGDPPNYLTMPPDVGPDLTSEGEYATVRYSSVINSAECNIFSTSTAWRPFTSSWLTLDWLAGFRYVGVDEAASIVIDCCADEGMYMQVPYRVRTANNMFGGQVGSRARWTWDRWAVESWAKAGLMGTSLQQSQDPLVTVQGDVVRQALSSWRGGVGFVGDINVSAIYRLTDVWGIRAGYNLVWFEGLALAPDQFDFRAVDAAGTRVDSGGGIFLHGANLGLEARW